MLADVNPEIFCVNVSVSSGSWHSKSQAHQLMNHCRFLGSSLSLSDLLLPMMLAAAQHWFHWRGQASYFYTRKSRYLTHVFHFLLGSCLSKSLLTGLNFLNSRVFEEILSMLLMMPATFNGHAFHKKYCPF